MEFEFGIGCILEYTYPFTSEIKGSAILPPLPTALHILFLKTYPKEILAFIEV